MPVPSGIDAASRLAYRRRGAVWPPVIVPPAVSFAGPPQQIWRGPVYGTGWIDTYRPSQIIDFGAYFHGVKKRSSWVGVSSVFGRMS